MKKILSIFCFMYVSFAYTAGLDESYFEDEMSYRDSLVFAMDNGLPADQASEEDYVSFFLIEALPSPSKSAKRLRADIEPIDEVSPSDDYSTVTQNPKILSSRSPIFDSFVYCAFSKDGAEIIDYTRGKIRINEYDKFLNCIDRVCVKSNPTKDAGSRIRSFKQFIAGWPKKLRAVQGDFMVWIKESSVKRISGLARFYKLVDQYQANMNNDISVPPRKRSKKSED